MSEATGTGMTLWQIDETVQGLMALREDESLGPDERAAIDQQLEQWTEAELYKVDRVRGYLKFCAAMEKIAAEAAKEYTARARVWENRGRRLKDICYALMQQRSVRRLEGATGCLRIQASGGKQALTITDSGAIPARYQVIKISVDEAAVRAALERGEQVPGAELEPRGEHLHVT